MRFRDGTFGQKTLVAAMIAVFVVSAGLVAREIAASLGRPSVGWTVDGGYVSPMRRDAADAGLRGGGRLVELNGYSTVSRQSYRQDILPRLHMETGETNVLHVRRPGGAVRVVIVPVRPLEPRDVVFGDGALIGLGVLAFLTGLTSFLLRPYMAGSWGLLGFAVCGGGLLIHLPMNVDAADAFTAFYVRSLIGFIPAVTMHVALTLPVVHPVLRRDARLLGFLYGAGGLIALYGVGAWYRDYAGVFRHLGTVDTSTMLAAMLFFVARCFRHAVRSTDPVVRQRARILLVGAFFGGAPPMLLRFLQNTLGLLAVDLRVVYWTISALLFALAYTTVQQGLMNARIAVRRAVIYGGAMLALTGIALLLISLRPYAVGLLLLPLLYFWPRFDARLNDWLYPQRARFPELIRACGDDLAGALDVGAVLDVLARAPGRLCDATSGVAFLFAGVAGPEPQLASVGAAVNGDVGTLEDETLVKLLAATRQDIVRDMIAVQAQFAAVLDECYAGFDRLHAAVLLPLVRDDAVVGGLALGPRALGDPYGALELNALSTVAQQTVQALTRVGATERLRAREQEFSDLKRFFPPQVIDQVMAQGGAAELRSQRKQVTVFFADLRGFTSFSDSVEPEEVMATLAEYHEAMGHRIAEFAGTLEHFVGDGFMVFFNDPVDQPDHIERAVRMALAMRDDMQNLRAGWERKGYKIDAGMGLHTGYATCGFVGYEGRRDYGVIGNVTNLAARLSDAAAGSEILVSTPVRAVVGAAYRLEPVGELDLKGFHQAQAVFRLCGPLGAA